MKLSLKKDAIYSLQMQRNFLVVMVCLMTFSNIILGSFVFSHSEKLIIIPPSLRDPISIDGHEYSSSYLEQMGFYLSHLFLTKSAYTAENQRNILLKHTHPSFSSVLEARLREEEVNLGKQDASYVFVIKEINTHPRDLSVQIHGEKILYLSGEKASRENESYKMIFSNESSRLLLRSIKQSGNNS